MARNKVSMVSKIIAVLTYFLTAFILSVSPLKAQQATQLVYTDDPATGFHGIWGPNVVITYNGALGNAFQICGTSSGCTGYAPTQPNPNGFPNPPEAQMGGFNYIFQGGANGEVFTVDPGGASCILVVIALHRYCGIPFPDDDGDGVANHVDLCPAQGNQGNGVDANGCPLTGVITGPNGGGSGGSGPAPDSDGDGIPDDRDQCPNQGNIGWGIYDNGCPILDSDGDGIPDTQDQCPNQGSIGWGIYDNGCPILDSDGDGIPDTQDQCPDQGDLGIGIFTDTSRLGCAIPDPLAGINANDNCALAANKFLDGNFVQIRSSAGEENPVVGSLDRTQSTDNILEVTQISGVNWYLITTSNTTGWVSGAVTRIAGDCDNIGNDQLGVDIVNEQCPNFVSAFTNYSDYVREYVNQQNDPCQLLAQIDPSATIKTSVVEQLPSMEDLADCPQYVPLFLEFASGLFVYPVGIETGSNRNTPDEVWDYLETLLDEDACAFGEFLARQQLPPSIPDELTGDLLIALCKDNITVERFNQIKEQLALFDIPISDFQSASSNCATIEKINIIGELTEGQQAIYERLRECQFTYDDALDLLLTVIVTQTDTFTVNWGDVSCESLLEVIIERPTIEITIPEALGDCPPYVTTLFLLNHLPVLEELSQNSGQDYYRLILEAPDPCFAMIVYITTGKLPQAQNPSEDGSAPIQAPPSPDFYVPAPPAMNPVLVRRGATPPTTRAEALASSSVTVTNINQELLFGFAGILSFDYAVYVGKIQIGNTLQHNIYVLESSSIQLQPPKKAELAEIGHVDYSMDSLGRLIYTRRDTNGNVEILTHVINSGSPLTYTALIGYSPVFNSRLVFLPNSFEVLAALEVVASGEIGIYKLDKTDSPPTLVIPDAQNPSISVGGNLIAFERRDGNISQIYVRNIATSNDYLVSPPDVNCYSPTFATDVNALDVFFICDEEGVQIIHQSGTTERQFGITGFSGRMQNLEYNGGILSFDDGSALYFGLIPDDGAPMVILPLANFSTRGESLYRLRWTR